MPSAPLKNRRSALADVALEVAWRQWHGIGAAAASKHPATSIVDPEALILFTLTAMEREHRFESLLFSWLELNAGLLSVQRMRNLQKLFPSHVRPYVQRFSHMARVIGKHPKWAALTGDEDVSEEALRRPERRRAVHAPLRRPGALLLRLRQAMGVGTKADVLTVLLGHAARPLTVKEIVDLTGYTNVAVRGAANALTSSGFIATLKDRPLRFAAPRDEWRSLLGLRSIPAWQPWAHFYAFTVAYEELSARASERSFSEYAFRSKLRDLVEHSPVLSARLMGDRPRTNDESDDVGDAFLAELVRWAMGNV